MIVKDEAHIIHESLTCTLPLIDTYCIVDTGSTDNTIQKIKDFYQSNGIQGEVHERPWKNFGHNRSEALALCDGNMDYALVIDADDLIEFPPNAKDIIHELLIKTNANCCNILIKQETIDYWRGQLFKCNDGWGYVGVLHEYPSNNKPNVVKVELPRDIFMISRRLGARSLTGDKLKRDIAVLTQGLIDEPDNDRYVFYLAQSYKDYGDPLNALKYYKKRFHMGRWAEEAWFSAYQVGMLYKQVGNIHKFEYWLQRAHDMRPWRAEPMYHLTEYFRHSGKLYKAYEYYKIGSQIKYPYQDVLFVEKMPYNSGFAYEKTIIDYYVHDNKKIGLRDSIEYLIKTCNLVESVLRNLSFYAAPISTKIKPLSISNPFGSKFRPSGINVLTYPYANVRYVNYLIPENNHYRTSDGTHIQTHNAYINIETGDVIAKMDDASITLPRIETQVKGLEDIRLFTQGTQLKFIATNIREYDPMIRMITGNYGIQTATYSDVSVLPSPESRGCEKNWLPIPHTDHIIYDWSPLTVMKLDGTILSKHSVPPVFSLFRGSASPVEVNNKWIAMVHIVDFNTTRKYYHLFVELERDSYMPTRISTPFVFKKPTIEYCTSMYLKDSTIVCYPSLMDSDPYQLTIDLACIDWVNI